MYNPNELRNKAQLNISGIDYNAKTNLETAPQEEHWGIRALATGGNFITNILQGAVKSIEGLFDAGAMLVGLTGVDVNDVVDYDFTSDLFGTDDQQDELFDWTWGKQLESLSYADNDNIVNQIASGVGGMLPAIAVNFIPGVGQALSATMFIGGAAGNASESALNEGVSYGQALGYGAVSGAIEGVTEMIGGRVFGETTKLGNTLLGKLATKTGTDKYITKGIGKVAYNFVSEGTEEVLADLLDPVNKRAWGLEDKVNINIEQLPKTFLIGGSVGAILDGAQRGVSALRNNDKGGKHYVNVADDLQMVINNNAVFEVAQQNSKLTQEQVDKASVRNAERNLEAFNRMSEEFSLMTEQQRQEALKTLNDTVPTIANLFEPNGNLKSDIVATLDETISTGKTKVGNVYSQGLFGQEQDIQNDIDTMNKQYVDSYIKEQAKLGNNITVEEAQEVVKPIKMLDRELSAKGKENYTKFSKFLKIFNKKSNLNTSSVIVETNDSFNASVVDGYKKIHNKIYIGADQFENDGWARALIHETTHLEEGSKEYREMLKHLLSENIKIAVKTSEGIKKVPLRNVASQLVIDKSNYGITEEGLDRIASKNVSELTEEESNILNTYYSEVVAHANEVVLGSEEFINKVIANDEPFVKRIINKLYDTAKALFEVENGKATSEIKSIVKAQKLYLKAARNAGKTRLEEYIRSKIFDFEKNEEVDNNKEIKYSLLHKNFPSERESGSEAHRLAIWWTRQPNTNTGDQTLISMGGKWYLVEYFDDADNHYQIEDIVSKQEFKQILKEIKENGRSGRILSIQGISNEYDKFNKQRNSLKGRESSFNSSKTQYSRENTEMVQLDSSENKGRERIRSDRSGDSESSGSNRQRYSLKQSNIDIYDEEIYLSTIDSEGNRLSQEQLEFFISSKVRDEKGNLQVCYHGTEGEFYVFDKALRGSSTGARDAQLGFFFTNSKDIAGEYAIYSQDNKLYNLRFKISGGDKEIIKQLRNVNEVMQMSGNELFEEYKRLLRKYEAVDLDIKEVYLNMKNPYIEDWRGKQYKKGKMLKAVETAILNDNDGVIIKNIDDGVDFSGIVSNTYIIFEPNQVKLTTNKKPTRRDDIRYSHKDKITIDSTEQERYEILKNKVLKNIPIITKQSDLIQSWEDINKVFGKEKRNLIQKIAEEFNVFKNYSSNEFLLDFGFSKTNYEESYSKQKHNFADFAKMFTVFDEVVNNAIGVEVHNRNDNGYKTDKTLEGVYVLVSAFQDGECIIPVKLEIKEFNDKQNTLYVAISLNKIKTTEVSGQGNTTSGVTQYSRSVANISIYCFLKKVNT